MRIVVLSDWFAEKMGYTENFLPRALASLGHEVHLVTSNVQPYFSSPMYKETYEPFIGPPIVPCGVKEFDGYTLHRLPYARWRSFNRIQGLIRTIREIRPQVVQAFDLYTPSTWQAALAKPFLGYKLFLETHCHASVFGPLLVRPSWVKRLYWRIYPFTIGRAVSAVSEKCYAISTDTAQIAARFFGVPDRQLGICSLGVDTTMFTPPVDERQRQWRKDLRARLGFTESEIVCVYTGRFSKGKDPIILARAIAKLVSEGKAYRGLFLGSGTPEEVIAIQNCPGCVVHPFVPVWDLPPFYWAAEIGVWPMQESTSQLDAAASGLPIIVSHRVQTRERYEGNGLTYQEGDAHDLAARLMELNDPQVRRRMGDVGISKVRRDLSWEVIARSRLKDYAASLEH